MPGAKCVRPQPLAGMRHKSSSSPPLPLLNPSIHLIGIMCPPGQCQRGRLPLCPPFSTLAWAFCVKNNCHCTNTGRKLRFWVREWYRLPGSRQFYPVERQSSKSSIPGSLDAKLDPCVERQVFGVVELEPKQCGRQVEYQMNSEGKEMYEYIKHEAPYGWLDCVVKAEESEESEFPPPYDMAVGNRKKGFARVVAEYYLPESQVALLVKQ